MESTAAQAKPYSCRFPLREGTRKPAVKNWRNTKPNNFKYPQYGYCLQPGELVIDCDPQNYPRDPIDNKLVDVWMELQDKWNLPRTKAVKTPSGGYHLYYLIPPELKICHKQPEWPGIDFQGHKRLVAGEGSKADVEGGGIGEYKAINDIEPQYLPAEFLASLKQVSEHGTAAIDMDDWDDSADNINNYKAWLNTAPPAIKGNVNNSLYAAACMGRDLSISLETTIECIADVYNPRCRPSAAENEIVKIASNAYQHAKGAQGAKNIEHVIKNDELLNSTAPPAKKPTEKAAQLLELRNRSLATHYALDGKGKERGNHIGNARLKLGLSTDYCDLFWYDEFKHIVRYERQPWWRNTKNDEMTDNDVLHIQDWITGKGDYPVCGKETLRDAIVVMSQMNARNPLTAELESFTWDGVKRLDTYLIDTCGAVDEEWNRVAGRKFLIGAIARAFQPGCQMDNALILQGETGLRKSTWVRVLGGKFATTGVLNPEDKDLNMKMLGAWIMELPEINQSLSKRDHNAIKGFITETKNRFRKPYGHVVEDVPKTVVFIGTINPTNIGYLKDPTGDRRYWPVYVGQCDPEKLEEMRDQLLAEAVTAYKAGEPWHLSPAQEKLAKKKQDAVKEQDPWVEVLKQKLGELDKLQTEDAYHLLGVPTNQITEVTRRRVYNALGYLDYEYSRSKMQWSKI